MAIDLKAHEYNGANYIYDMEALCNNTFYMADFKSSPESISEEYQPLTVGLPNASFRLQNVKINGMTLEWDNINSFKKFANVSEIKQGTTVSFTWLEDGLNVVDAFHKIWFNAWYSRENQRFKTGVAGKFINSMVSPYHYVVDENGTLQPELVTTFNFEMLAPTDLQEVSVDVGASGEQLITYTYKYMRCRQTIRADPKYVQDKTDSDWLAEAKAFNGFGTANSTSADSDDFLGLWI